MKLSNCTGLAPIFKLKVDRLDGSPASQKPSNFVPSLLSEGPLGWPFLIVERYWKHAGVGATSIVSADSRVTAQQYAKFVEEKAVALDSWYMEFRRMTRK